MEHPDPPAEQAPRKLFRLPAIDQEHDPFRREVLELAHEVLGRFGEVEIVDGPVGSGGLGETVDLPPGAAVGPPATSPATPQPARPSAHPPDLDLLTPVLVWRAAAFLRRAARGGREAEALVLLEVGRRRAAFVHEVALRLGMPETTVQSVVDRLVRRGELARSAVASDGRLRLVELTPAGAARAARTAALYQELDETLLAAVTPTERDRLRAMLRRITRLLAPA